MGCLYQLTSPSGKSYIGITNKTVAIRFSKHVEHALGKRQNGVIYSALRKYRPGREWQDPIIRERRLTAFSAARATKKEK